MSDLLVRGAIWGGQSAPTPQTASQSGALRIADAHARFHESSVARRRFLMDSDSITAAAAHATKGALATVKFLNGFYNPAGSKVLAVIERAKVATVSGTPAGPYFYNYITDLVINSAATGTIRNAYLMSPTSSNSGSSMTPQTNVVLAAIGGPTTALTQLGVLGGPAAIAAGAGLYSADDLVDGAIIIPPGTLFGICATGAGTSHVVQSTLQWEEVPLLY